MSKQEDEGLSPAEALFLTLCDLPESERQERLDEQTAGQPALKDEVERMLAADARSEKVLSGLSDRLRVSFRRVEPGDDRRGQTCGNYTLLQRIGTGGMGDVWLAERSDGRFDGQFAVKLLRMAMTSEATLLRFEKEGRLLARLAHTNIARLIDAGASDGQPFLVLEFVKGQPIDDYCRARHLGVVERVKLFLQVLDGVSHAHANLVVHRDLKPSNIYVTESGTVKLLDFGVATLANASEEEPGGSLTQVYGQILTPDYAAPEQLKGGTISTATDVYSLGLVLYEVLSGNNPRVGSTGERRTASAALPAASQHAAVGGADDALRRALAGDLDNILRKATATEAAERYQSAVDFSNDLQNYITHRPVTARPPTLSYRTAKFVQRYRGGVAAGLLFFIGLLAAALIVNGLRITAERERDFALYQQQRASTSGELLYRLLNDDDVANDTVSIAEIFRRSAATLDRRAPADQRYAARMYFDLAQGFERLNQSDREADYLGRARIAAQESGDDDLLANVLCELTRDENETSADAAAEYFRLAELAAARVRRLSPETRSRCARAQALILENRGLPEDALRALEQAYAAIVDSPARNLHVELTLLNELGNHYHRSGRYRDALAINEKSLEIMRATGRLATFGGLVTQGNGAALLGAFGRLREENEAFRELLLSMSEDSPNRIGFLRSLAASYMKLAQPSEALAILEPMAALPQQPQLEAAAAILQIMLARAYLASDQSDRVESLIDQAEAVLSQSPGRHRRVLGWIPRLRSELQTARGDLAGADRLLSDALADAGYPGEAADHTLSVLLEPAARTAYELGDDERAISLASRWREVAVRQAPDPELSADVGRSCFLLARAYRRAGRAAEAGEAQRCAVTSLGNGLGANHPETIAAAE